MKKLWVLTCFAFWVVYSGQAQPPSFAKLYKKAYNFKSVSPDSVFFWAQKSLNYAQTPAQKYQAYYLIGYIAYQAFEYKKALHAYQKTLQYASDSVTKFNAINTLTYIHFRLGNYSQALEKNQQCRQFFQEKKQWISLSYAYDLWGRILTQQQDSSGLTVLNRALKLKQRYAPKQVGSSYINLTEAFAQLHKYDSAVAYQRKAIKYLVFKPRDKVSILKIYLAKYLIFTNKLLEAQKLLDEVKFISINQGAELTLCHVRNLLLLAKGETNASYSKYCDSLFRLAVHHPIDSINKIIAKERAVTMYKDALQVKNSRKNIYEKDHQVKSISSRLIGFGIGLLITLALIFFQYYRRRQASNQQPLSPPRSRTELDLIIERIELICNKQLKEDEIAIIRLRKAGVTYREIAVKLQIKESTVRNKMSRLAKRGHRTNIESFF